MTRFVEREADWLGAADALGRVLAAVTPLPPERISPGDALGRALASPVRARANLPPWDNSAMDGYAVRADDLGGATEERPVTLRVVGSVRAGAIPSAPVGPGEAVRIMTGAPVPEGADTVVRVEDTDAEAGGDDRVRIRSDRDAGRHLRPGGQDWEAGDVVLEAGAAVTPGALAVALAAGAGQVEVHGRPTVAIVSNGDELRGPDRYDDVVAGRGVPESNGPMLAAAVAAAGGVPRYLGVAADREDSIRERIEAAGGADLLITVGGASMGEADLFKRVLDGLGFELDFWRARIRPGSPVGLGRLPRDDGPLPVLGLPGNPASAFVTFQLFARPAVLRLAGHARLHRPTLRARAAEPLRSVDGLIHFHRVVLEGGGGASGEPRVRPTGPQGSGLVRSLGAADGLAVVPEGVERVEEGEAVTVILLHDAPATSETPGW